MSFQALDDERDPLMVTAENGTHQMIPRGPRFWSSLPLDFNESGYGYTGNVRGNPGFNEDGGGYPGNVSGGVGQMEGRWEQGFREGSGGGRSHIGRPQHLRRDQSYMMDGVGGRGSVNRDRGYQRRGEGTGNAVDADLPQLVQEIKQKLSEGTVECMICYDMVKRTAPVWSCSSCYSIFHLNCIKKWASVPTSVDAATEKSQGFNWRCPGCQAVQLTASNDIRYVCFCGKRHDPQSDVYLTPHSCGEPCGKPLEKEVMKDGLSEDDLCPHVCVFQCHPGPCPPCKAFAPPRPCPCGKKLIMMRCSERRSKNTCRQVCDKILECERHQCDNICHVGPCEPCQVSMDASCFCKRTYEMVVCGDLSLKGEIMPDSGLFSCSSTCRKNLKCENHQCVEKCHPGPCGECEFLPSKVKTCYCGNTNVTYERRSCLDPIPTCSGKCGRSLPCGKHYCKDKCHSGMCPPCSELVTQSCRCGSTSRTVECYRTTLADEKFVCDRPCKRKKNCKRHRCSELCCPFSDSSNMVSNDLHPHFCLMPCGKKLKCGQHSCEKLCHGGLCSPCLETIFNDLTCACGRTSIPPPLPCGTPLPSCKYLCSVPQPCGHNSIHSCHFGDCPRCSVHIFKECIGGHAVCKIPCWMKEITCNNLCGKTRRCRLHTCARNCHLPPCDSSSEPSVFTLKASCGQVCGAPRRDCSHTCQALCHPSAPCPDLRCEYPVAISCSCGRITATVPCDAGGSTSSFYAAKLLEASILELPAPLQPVEANDKKVPLCKRKLICDNECSKLQRKRVLAEAIDITQPSLDALHFGDNPEVAQVLSQLLRRDPKWVLAVEERCTHLVLGAARGSSGSSIMVHVFCTMTKEKRDAIRLIAERWKLSINVAGREPKRFVVVHSTVKSKAPLRVLRHVDAHYIPGFDPYLDIDPRLIVALLDLPSEADISTLILRFGGECELVWLNDKSALAVFSDAGRAATALRTLANGSVYQGASLLWKCQEVPVTSTMNRLTLLNSNSSSRSKASMSRVVDYAKRTAAATSSSSVQLMGLPDDSTGVAGDSCKASE